MTVYEITGMIDTVGGRTSSASIVSGMQALPCRLMTVRGNKQPFMGQQGAETTHKLFTQVIAITERNVIEIDGVRYAITLVDNMYDDHLEIYLRQLRIGGT